MATDVSPRLGQRIRKDRIERGMTQKEAGMELFPHSSSPKSAGVTFYYVEHGRRSLDEVEKRKLARLFHQPASRYLTLRRS